MIPTVPRFEEVFFEQTSFLELAEQLTYSYYMRLAMPRNGEDHDTHMRNWALDVFPLALMHLDEMYEHHGDALGEAINQEYTPKVGYGMFLTMNSDVLPLLDNWLNSTEGQAELSAWLEQHGFGGTIYPEELGAMLRY